MSARKVIPVLVLAGAAAYLVYQFGYPRIHHDANRLRISGNIEAIEAQLGFKIPGPVQQRPVDEGYSVNRGTLIAVLDTSDLKQDVALRKAELEAAEANLAALVAGSRPEEIRAAEGAMKKAGALLAELEAGSRPQEIAIAQATLESSTADKIRLDSEYKRAAELRKRNAIAEEDYDRAQAAYLVAVARMHDAAERLSMAKEGPRREEIDQARAAYNQARAQYELVKAGPRKEDIDAGRARAEQAKANLRLAEVRLGYATLTSPMDGVVLSKNIEPGEYVAPGTPVVTVADLKNIWVRGYVNEMDVPRVKLQQRVRVTTDGLPGKVFEGHVGFISQEAEFTPKTVQTEQERVKLVYRVKIYIVNEKLQLKPGMPADAEILLEPESGK